MLPHFRDVAGKFQPFFQKFDMVIARWKCIRLRSQFVPQSPTKISFSSDERLKSLSNNPKFEKKTGQENCSRNRERGLNRRVQRVLSLCIEFLQEVGGGCFSFSSFALHCPIK